MHMELRALGDPGRRKSCLKQKSAQRERPFLGRQREVPGPIDVPIVAEPIDCAGSTKKFLRRAVRDANRPQLSSVVTRRTGKK